MLVKINEDNEVVQYPYTFNELRMDHSSVSFPEEYELTNEILKDFNAALVVPHDIPSYNIYQDVIEIMPIFDGSQWQQSYQVIEKSDKEKADIKEAAQQNMWEQIQVRREEEKIKGVTVNGYQFHGSDPSRIQYLGLAILGTNLPSGIKWKTKTGAMVEMTPQIVQQIIAAIAVRDNQIFIRSEQHRQGMMQAYNPYDYDFSDWT